MLYSPWQRQLRSRLHAGLLCTQALQQPMKEILGDLHSSKRLGASAELEDTAPQLGSCTPLAGTGCLDRMLFVLSLSA